MRLSAGHIRSISLRMARAEEAAFPGLRMDRSHFPYNLKSSIPASHVHSVRAFAPAKDGLL
jgi:hypothetical protein